MSRVGKLPIKVPENVEVTLESDRVSVAGPKGSLECRVAPQVFVSLNDGELRVSRSQESSKIKALHGLTRKLLSNMVLGVSEGFKRVLEINGVGYRAELRDRELHLSLGYSHPVVFHLPAGVTATIERQTVITLECHDKQLLGQTAAVIRQFRPPEPYKGKGIRYQGEFVRRKAGKAMGASGGA